MWCHRPSVISVAAGPIVDTEGNAPVGQRDTEITVVSISIHIAIKNDIAVDPIVAAANTGGAAVFRQVGLHPPLKGEVGLPDVHRASRAV